MKLQCSCVVTVSLCEVTVFMCMLERLCMKLQCSCVVTASLYEVTVFMCI